MRRTEFRLGSHTIRPAVDEIVVDEGGTQRIEPKAMEVLLALVDAAPDPITPKELLERVWPDTVVVDNVVHKAVARLRRALGDDTQKPGYIETIPRRGYRLIAHVEKDVRAEAAEVPNSDSDIGVGASKRKPSFAVAIALVLAIVAAGVWWGGFSVRNDTLETVAEAEPLLPDAVTVPRNSIAVLPFENLSDLSENAFFAAGMQEDILNNLSHIPGLLVTSRTTTLLYIDSGLSLPEIAEELKVAYIMEGSVRRVDEEIRISLQLIDAANDKHVWSQSFDRTIQDVFAIQAEVAERVAQELQLKIVSERPAEKPTDNVVAYDLFLRGRELASQVSTSSLERALNLYESAIEVDPRFAEAYAGKATALALLAHYYPSQWQVQRDHAFAAAEKALELDPDSAEANLSMGSILTAPTEARYADAAAYLKRAVAKNPNDTLSRFYLMIAYSFLQQKDEMAVEAHEIYRRDPLSTRSNVAMALVAGMWSKPEETRKHLRLALQADDIAPYWHWVAGRASWWAGDYHAAAHHLHSALELDPQYAWARSELIVVFLSLGDMEAADRWIRKAEAVSAVGADFVRSFFNSREQTVDDYVDFADAWLERSPANGAARMAVASAQLMRAEASFRGGDLETFRTLAAQSLEAQLGDLRGPDGDISVTRWNVDVVMDAATTAASLGEKSLAEGLCRRILELYVSRETPLWRTHGVVARAKALLGRSQEAIEHLEKYFEAGGGIVMMEPVFNDTYGIYHELPAMAADRGVRKKVVERNAATLRRIREDYPALFED